MAIIEVSEDALRRMADGEVFGQALIWVEKAAGLRVDGMTRLMPSGSWPTT